MCLVTYYITYLLKFPNNSSDKIKPLEIVLLILSTLTYCREFSHRSKTLNYNVFEDILVHISSRENTVEIIQ